MRRSDRKRARAHHREPTGLETRNLAGAERVSICTKTHNYSCAANIAGPGISCFRQSSRGGQRGPVMQRRDDLAHSPERVLGHPLDKICCIELACRSLLGEGSEPRAETHARAPQRDHAVHLRDLTPVDLGRAFSVGKTSYVIADSVAKSREMRGEVVVKLSAGRGS